jgi:hypothetical protein
MIELRIPAALFERISVDLRRPHAFAAERVGFLYARPDLNGANMTMILAVDYWTVPDQHYVVDHSVGAKIDAVAIREAMQHALSSGLGAFHVHEHDWPGQPGFSGVDDRESSKLMPSFKGVVPGVPHGAIIFGRDGICGKAWFGSTKKPQFLSRVSVVGFPLRIYV